MSTKQQILEQNDRSKWLVSFKNISSLTKIAFLMGIFHLLFSIHYILNIIFVVNLILFEIRFYFYLVIILTNFSISVISIKKRRTIYSLLAIIFNSLALIFQIILIALMYRNWPLVPY